MRCFQVRLLVICLAAASLWACQSDSSSTAHVPFEFETTPSDSPSQDTDTTPQSGVPTTTSDSMSDDSETRPTSNPSSDNDPAHTSPIDTDPDTNTEAGPLPLSTRFSENATHWQVPDSGNEDGFFSLTWAYSTRWFATVDLNGDGRLDLVQTGDAQRSNGFVWRDPAGPYWKVWLGENEGFASEYLRWTVPESGLDDGFFFTSWSDGQRWFNLRDLDGDGRLDLIQSADSTREGGHVWQDELSGYWKVWRGRTGGFDPDPINWRVPDSGLSDGFFALQWTHGTRWFATLDVNGDARPDLLQTADETREGGHVFRDEEGSYWKVWLNTGERFAATEQRWAVPESGLSDGFFSPYWTMGERSFSTMDLNGDGLVDLVQSADSTRPGGHVWQDEMSAFWRVWLGTGEGFEPVWIRWAVPDNGLNDGFFAPWYFSGERSFGTIDMTGDGIPDLVQTANSGRTGGYVWHDERGSYWKVWHGTDDGFAATAHRWTVPSTGSADGFYTTHASTGTQWFSTMDLNGDGRPDLIQTGDPAQDGGFVWQGEDGPYWRVWLGQSN